MLERLRALDVCGFHPAIPTPFQLPQGDLGPGGTLEAGPIKQHVQRSTDAEPLMPLSVVCSYPVISMPYSLLIVCSS